MKKLVSMMLCFLIIISVITAAFTTASAALATTLFLDEECDAQIKSTSDKLLYSFCAPADGYYDFYSVSDFDLFVTVKDNNDNVVTTDDNSNHGGDFKATFYMNAGDCYSFEVKAYDIFHDGRFSLYLKESENAVTKLEVKKLPLKTEYEYGTIVHDIDYTGLELTATLKSGETVNWCYDTDDKAIAFMPLVFKVDYNCSPVVVQISCGGAMTSFTLDVLPSTIKSIELVDAKPFHLHENSSGYYDYEKDYFHYYYDTPQFDVLVTFADGTQVLTDTSKAVDGNEFHFYDNQYSQPFTTGDNTAFVTLMGAKAEYTVTILPSPVLTFSVEKQPHKQYTKSDEEFISYNEYTDVYTIHTLDLSGIIFTLYFDDGTQKTYTDSDIDFENNTIDGEKFYVSKSSITDIGTQYVSFNFMGCDIYYRTRIVDIDTVIGDADNDHKVSVLDATAIQMHLSEIAPLTDTQLRLCDTDIDGTVSVLDATKIQMFRANKIESL